MWEFVQLPSLIKKQISTQYMQAPNNQFDSLCSSLVRNQHQVAHLPLTACWLAWRCRPP